MNATIDNTWRPHWFSIELRPMPRTTTRTQWKECNRWRRITQRLLRESIPTPPELHWGRMEPTP